MALFVALMPSRAMIGVVGLADVRVTGQADIVVDDAAAGFAGVVRNVAIQLVVRVGLAPALVRQVVGLDALGAGGAARMALDGCLLVNRLIALLLMLLI